jgi:signal transduction histidine kinase
MAASTDENGAIRKAVDRFLSARVSVLWIGFTGLLLLMAVVAIDAATSIRDVEGTTAALRTESRQRDGLLDQLRADIYRSATVVRDYLLELDAARADSQKAELELIRTRIDDTLIIYEQKLPDTEKDAFKDLRSRLESYWKLLAPALQWDAAVRRAEGGSFLQDVIMPFRTQVVQLTRQVTALNERDLDAGEERIRAVQSRFQQRVAIISVFALVLGLILGAVSIRRVQHLEREAKARYEEVEEARRELQKLSDRLVTAQEEERRNLSRELHDEIGQGMSAMLVELGRVEAAPDSETRGERLASVRRMAEASVGMIRNMALLLRPSMLDDLGLVAALSWQAREVTRRSGLKVKMVADEIAEDLPDSHRTCLYRVVQEALNNCAKHSQATQVRVVVHRDRDGLSVTVQDDGIGFEPSRDKGMGLLGMEERVERLGGLFSIESEPGNGTVLRIHFPLANGGPASVKDTV